jgi:hypothetical protein
MRFLYWKRSSVAKCARSVAHLKQSMSFSDPLRELSVPCAKHPTSIVDNRPYRKPTDVRAKRQPKRSFTGSSRFCLQPR